MTTHEHFCGDVKLAPELSDVYANSPEHSRRGSEAEAGEAPLCPKNGEPCTRDSSCGEWVSLCGGAVGVCALALPDEGAQCRLTGGVCTLDSCKAWQSIDANSGTCRLQEFEIWAELDL